MYRWCIICAQLKFTSVSRARIDAAFISTISKTTKNAIRSGFLSHPCFIVFICSLPYVVRIRRSVSGKRSA